MATGWCECFIGPPLTAAFSAYHACYAAAYINARSFSAKTCLDTTPTVRSTTWPSLNSSTVGIDRMPYCAASYGLLSTFTFPTVACPSNSTASSSIVGVRTRHGPHHGAQKSTRIGCALLRTSREKVASLKVTSLAVAVVIRCSLRCYGVHRRGVTA